MEKLLKTNIRTIEETRFVANSQKFEDLATILIGAD
jgi:hypothetical protein